MKIAQVQTPDRLVNQLQQNISQAVEPIFANLTGNFVVSMTGGVAVPSGVAKWEAPTASGPVYLQLPLITATSNTTAVTLLGLPSNLWPTTAQTMFLMVEDSGAAVTGSLVIAPSGTMTVYKTVGGGAFTNSGTKGVLAQTVTYPRGI